MVDRLTLDTTALFDLWKNDGAKHAAIQALLALARDGQVDLAVTARVREDVPDDPLAQEINRLPEVGIAVIGSVTRIGLWRLGEDLLGDDEFVAWAKGLPGPEPNPNDLDHLNAHMLHGRDYFLTSEKSIRALSGELEHRFGIRVLEPAEYLQRRNPGGGR